MSQTVFIIKCICCKSEFNQGDSYKRICQQCVDTRARRRAKEYAIQRRKIPKIKPDYYEIQCKACDTIFRTKNNNKQFCNNKCVEQYASFPKQLINTEKNILRIEERIEQANTKYEQRIIQLEKQLEKINYEFESQRIVYEKKLEFLRSRK